MEDANEDDLSNCMGAWNAIATVLSGGPVANIETSNVPRELASVVACYMTPAVSPIILASVCQLLASAGKVSRLLSNVEKIILLGAQC